MFLLLCVVACLARDPNEKYDMQLYNDKDEHMSEMYSLDRQVQVLEIKVKETEYKINQINDEIALAVYGGSVQSNTNRINVLNKVLQEYKTELHNAAINAVAYYDQLAPAIQTEFNTMYNYSKRIEELRKL